MPSTQIMKPILLSFILGITLFSSCKKPGDLLKEKELASHERMVFLLDSLGKAANPTLCYNLNAARAEMARNTRDQSQDPNAKIQMNFTYCTELLNAGKSKEGIAELEAMINSLGGIDALLTPTARLIVEYLALGYLRLGEQQNCILNHNSSSCIVPIQGDGIHKEKQGSEKAIELYKKILTKFPDDLQSKWLMNVAYMTLGKYPNDVPAQYKVDPKFFSKNSSLKEFRDVAPLLGLDVRGMSGGVCMEDFNNDGLLDIFCTAYGFFDQCKFFINKGENGFEEVSEKWGLKGITGGLNVLHTDYNNDGNKDIFILRGGWLGLGGKLPNSLLKNNGDGTFTDVTVSSGILSFHPTQTGSWADFNSDGNLDLFIGNESNSQEAHPSELFMNNGDGTFTEVSSKVGLSITAFVKGCNWGDINGDLLPDLYISVGGGPNLLYVNRGGTSLSDWKFEEISKKAGVDGPIMSFPTWFWDFDEDGLEDIFVSGYELPKLDKAGSEILLEFTRRPYTSATPRLYKNMGNETFKDVTVSTGLDKVMFSMGCNFGDINNDGYLDFYVGTGTPDLRSVIPNRMFLNIGGKRFEEVTMNGFANIQKGHGIAMGDLDKDGDQDIYAVIGGAFEGDVASNVLYENPIEKTQWINLTLVGIKSNKAAIGSLVKVTLTENGVERSIYRRVNTGASFGSQSLSQEIGLGKNGVLKKVEVFWPASKGKSVEITGVANNGFFQITEGDNAAKSVASKPINLLANCKTPNMHKHN
jgi:tetratricopeptide (TPR) repeat protein